MTASWYFQMKKLEEIGLTCFRDKTIKYWDGRCPKTPVITYELEEKVYAADVKDNLGVFGMHFDLLNYLKQLAIITILFFVFLKYAGLAEKHVLIFDLNYPQKPFRTLESPLKFQTRSISCFIDYKGYAIGSIEG